MGRYDDYYWESHEGELYEMYLEYIQELVEKEGGTVDDMIKHVPFNEWREDL